MLEHPPGERQVIVAHGDVEHPSRAGTVATHAEHRPVGIVPVGLAAELHSVLVDHLQEPQHAAVESRVVDDLDVVRLRAALEQESHECVALRMRRPVLFAFADDADERRVDAAAGHEVRVRIGAVVQQRPRDGDRVVAGRGERNAREAEIEQRVPPFGAAFLGCGLGPVGERLHHTVDVAADDRGVEAVARDVGVALEETPRDVPRSHVRGCAANVVIGARVLDEPGDAAGVLRLGWCACRELVLECRPPREPVLARERVLDVAQATAGLAR